MPAPIAKPSLTLLLALLLAGCGTNQPGSHSEQRSSCDREVTARQFQEDPCAIALTPLARANASGSAHRAAGPKVARYQEAVRRANRPIPALERLGWTFVEVARIDSDPGFYRLAEQVAQCIEAKQPDSAEALLLWGHVMHNLHRFKEAEATARKLVAQRGTWFDYGLLGDALMEQGDLDEAIHAYQRMMDERPGPQAYSRAAHMRWLRGDVAGAIEMMRKAVQASGSTPSEGAAWGLTRLALYHMQAGEFEAAQRLAKQSLLLHPHYAPALLALGRILLAQHEDDAAVVHLERANRLNPSPEYQWALIEALRATGRTEHAHETEAQLHARGASEDGRSYALYLATTGQKLGTAKRLAFQELKVRQDVFTLDAVAWALNASGQHQQALVFSRRALAQGTQDARLFYHAGVIAASAGDTQQASRLLRRGIAMQQTLLPSERADLAKEFAALAPQIPHPTSVP